MSGWRKRGAGMNTLEFPRARIEDPETSHLAAQSAEAFASKHYNIILETLQTYGPLGKDGIASRGNIDKSQVSRRLSEMQQMGLIRLTGKTVASSSGRSEREWEAI